MSRAIKKELREAAPDMLAFLISIQDRTTLMPDDISELKRLIVAATIPSTAVVVPINLHTALLETFEAFYLEQFGTAYLFNKVDAIKFSEIKKFIERKGIEAGIPPSDISKQCAGFRMMLHTAMSDKFIGNNFRPAIIAQNLNNIYLATKNKQRKSTLAERMAQAYQ